MGVTNCCRRGLADDVNNRLMIQLMIDSDSLVIFWMFEYLDLTPDTRVFDWFRCALDYPLWFQWSDDGWYVVMMMMLIWLTRAGDGMLDLSCAERRKEARNTTTDSGMRTMMVMIVVIRHVHRVPLWEPDPTRTWDTLSQTRTEPTRRTKNSKRRNCHGDFVKIV